MPARSFSLSAAFRVLLVAAGLGAGALAAAAPAQAQQITGFNFSVDLGNGAQLSIGAQEPAAQFAQHPGHWDGRDRGRGPHWDGRIPHRAQVCLTDRDIHRQLRQHGYEDARLGRERRGVVEATARHRGWIYSMEIDRCSGRISGVRELHPAHRGDRRGFGNNFYYSN